MRKTYKNKRDQYKAEAERWKQLAEIRQKRLDELERAKPKTEERINVAWFCPQCRVVAKGTARRGFNIEGSDCLNCGKRGIMAVSKLPHHFGLE